MGKNTIKLFKKRDCPDRRCTGRSGASLRLGAGLSWVAGTARGRTGSLQPAGPFCEQHSCPSGGNSASPRQKTPVSVGLGGALPAQTCIHLLGEEQTGKHVGWGGMKCRQGWARPMWGDMAHAATGQPAPRHRAWGLLLRSSSSPAARPLPP